MWFLNLCTLIERYLTKVFSEFFKLMSESWRKNVSSSVQWVRGGSLFLCLWSLDHLWFSPATSRLLAEKGSKIYSYSYSIVFTLVCIQCPVLSMHICTTYYIKLILIRRYPVLSYCRSVGMFIPVFCFYTPYVGLYLFLFY